MRLICIVGFFTLIFPLAMAGQVILEGKVSGIGGSPVANIHILVYIPGSQSIAGFAVSDRDGAWRLGVNLPIDSLDIVTSSVSYRSERRRIPNKSQTLHFDLVAEVRQLQEFTVRAPNIVQRGDTISYLVSAFASDQDRTISDVLTRMPGIEVEASGRILYQGRPIQRFYVEGLDLMGGRYVMVSQNLPHRSVATVEILENHQPIRILENRVPSFESSLNLRLKRAITTTGTGRMSTGPRPLLWYANITPMTFIDDFQVLTSYQSNNSGRDVSWQLRQLTLDDLRHRMDRPRDNPSMLSLPTFAPSGLPGRRFLLNNIHLINTNGLMRLNNNMQLRANLFYVNDSQRQQGMRYSALFTPTDTISFVEHQESRFFSSHLQGELTLSRNVAQQFLENKLRFSTLGSSRRGIFETGPDNLIQALNSPFHNITNDLRVIHPMGKHLVEFMSFIMYDRSPHQLSFSPGRFEQALGLEHPIENMRQESDRQRFYADHSAGFTFTWRGLSIGPRIGFSYHQQSLATHLLAMQNNQWVEPGQIFANQLDGSHSRAYLQTEVGYRRNQLTITARIPLSLQTVQIQDNSLQQGQRYSKLMINPSISAGYRPSAMWEIWGSLSHNTRFGEIDDVYYGYILLNTRRLQRNAAPLSETASHNFSANIRYRNPFASLFAMVGYSFSTSSHNLMFSNQIQPGGSTVLQAIAIPNRSFMHSIFTNNSISIRPTRTNIQLNANFNHSRRMVLVNDQQFETANPFLNINPRIDQPVTTWLNLEYNANLTNFWTFLGGNHIRNITLLRHYAGFLFTPVTGHSLNLTTEHFSHEGNVSYFVDLEYRFTIRNKSIDININLQNILNATNYTSFSASDFSVVKTTYAMRPRQLVLSARLSF
jgi:hypothetical protein